MKTPSPRPVVEMFYAFIFILGLLDWGVSLLRVLALFRKKRLLLFILILIENALAFYVLSEFIISKDWILIVSYIFGAATGGTLASFLPDKK
jgi:hypothetical protein